MDRFERRAKAVAEMSEVEALLRWAGDVVSADEMRRGIDDFPVKVPLPPLPHTERVLLNRPWRETDAEILPDAATPDVRALLEADLKLGRVCWTREVDNTITRVDPNTGGE